jgi:hypothetical protein
MIRHRFDPRGSAAVIGLVLLLAGVAVAQSTATPTRWWRSDEHGAASRKGGETPRQSPRRAGDGAAGVTEVVGGPYDLQCQATSKAGSVYAI